MRDVRTDRSRQRPLVGAGLVWVVAPRPGSFARSVWWKPTGLHAAENPQFPFGPRLTEAERLGLVA